VRHFSCGALQSYNSPGDSRQSDMYID